MEELVFTPLKQLWKSTSTTSWSLMPNLVRSNVNWLSVSDLDFLCNLTKEQHGEHETVALAECLGIVGVNCPSYRKNILSALGKMMENQSELVLEKVNESLKYV